MRPCSFLISLVAPLGVAACDPGSTLKNSQTIDPQDMGSDEDVGAGDLGPTPVDVH